MASSPVLSRSPAAQPLKLGKGGRFASAGPASPTVNKQGKRPLEWTQLESLQGPDKRSGHTLVQYNNRYYVFGGQSTSFPMNDLWQLEMVGQSALWTKIEPANLQAPQPCRRVGHSAVVVGKRMWIFGGDTHAACLSDVWVWDFETRSWEECIQRRNTFEPEPRYGHATEVVGNNIVLFGGANRHVLADEDSGKTETVFYEDLWLFDTIAKVWEFIDVKVGDRPTRRYGHSLTMVGPRLYLFGGFMSEGLSRTRLNDLWELNPRSFIWRCEDIGIRGIQPPHLYNHTAMAVGANELVFYGGVSSNTPSHHLLLFDTAKRTWKLCNPANPPLGRCLHGACVASNGHDIVVFAGMAERSQIAMSDVWVLPTDMIIHPPGKYATMSKDVSEVFTNVAALRVALRPDFSREVQEPVGESLRVNWPLAIEKAVDVHDQATQFISQHTLHLQESVLATKQRTEENHTQMIVILDTLMQLQKSYADLATENSQLKEKLSSLQSSTEQYAESMEQRFNQLSDDLDTRTGGLQKQTSKLQQSVEQYAESAQQQHEQLSEDVDERFSTMGKQVNRLQTSVDQYAESQEARWEQLHEDLETRFGAVQRHTSKLQTSVEEFAEAQQQQHQQLQEDLDQKTAALSKQSTKLQSSMEQYAESQEHRFVQMVSDTEQKTTALQKHTTKLQTSLDQYAESQEERWQSANEDIDSRFAASSKQTLKLQTSVEEYAESAQQQYTQLAEDSTAKFSSLHKHTAVLQTGLDTVTQEMAEVHEAVVNFQKEIEARLHEAEQELAVTIDAKLESGLVQVRDVLQDHFAEKMESAQDQFQTQFSAVKGQSDAYKGEIDNLHSGLQKLEGTLDARFQSQDKQSRGYVDQLSARVSSAEATANRDTTALAEKIAQVNDAATKLITDRTASLHTQWTSSEAQLQERIGSVAELARTRADALQKTVTTQGAALDRLSSDVQSRLTSAEAALHQQKDTTVRLTSDAALLTNRVGELESYRTMASATASVAKDTTMSLSAATQALGARVSELEGYRTIATVTADAQKESTSKLHHETALLGARVGELEGYRSMATVSSEAHKECIAKLQAETSVLANRTAELESYRSVAAVTTESLKDSTGKLTAETTALNHRVSDLEGARATLSGAVQQHSEGITRLQSDVQQTSHRVLDVENAQTQARSVSDTHRDQIRQLSGDSAQYAQRLVELETARVSSGTAAEQVRTMADTLMETSAQHTQQLAELEAYRAAATSGQAALHDRITTDVTQCNERVDTLQKHLHDSQRQDDDRLRKHAASTDEQVQLLRDQMLHTQAQLQTESDRLQTRQTDLHQAAQHQTSDALSAVQTEVRSVQTQMQERLSGLLSRQQEDVVVQSLGQAAQQVRAAEERVTALERMQDKAALAAKSDALIKAAAKSGGAATAVVSH